MGHPYDRFLTSPSTGRYDRFLTDPEEEERKRKLAAVLNFTESPDDGGGTTTASQRSGRRLLQQPSRTLHEGGDIPGLVATAPAPKPTIGRALQRATLEDVEADRNPYARFLRDSALYEKQRSLETKKRFFTDVAFTAPQAAVGALSNLARKVGVFENALPRTPWAPSSEKAVEGLDTVAGKMMAEGGAVNVPVPFFDFSVPWQLGANLAGNIGSEVALFRGAGQLATRGADALAGAAEGTRAGGITRQIATLMEKANELRGAKGVGARAVRDLAANLPLDLTNAASPDLSSTAFLAQVTKNPTLEKLASTYPGRVAGELATDLLPSAALDAIGEAARRIRLPEGPGAATELGNAIRERRMALDDDFHLGDRGRNPERPGGERTIYRPTPQTPTRDYGAPLPPPEAATVTPPREVPTGPTALEPPPQFPWNRGTNLVGRETTVRFGDARALPARYQVVELDDLIPSHEPFGYQPRADYPEGVQGRGYDRDPASQAANQQKAANLDPYAVIDPSFSPQTGPPTVTPDGVVIAGNDRTMAMQRAAQQFPENTAAYRRALEEHAGTFGYSPEALAGFKNPVLVRVLDHSAGDLRDPNFLRDLNLASDISTTKGKTLLDQGAGKAQQFRQAGNALRHFQETIGPEESVSEYLRTANGRAFVGKLMEDGVITQAELPQYVDVATNTLTEQGRELVRSMMLSSVIEDTGIIARAPVLPLNRLEQAIPAILSLQNTPHDLTPLVEQALDLLGRAQATGKSIEELVQPELSGASISADVLGMARFLDKASKTKVSEAFKYFATRAREALAREADGASDMFGDLAAPMDVVFHDAFGFQREGGGPNVSAMWQPDGASHEVQMEKWWAHNDPEGTIRAEHEAADAEVQRLMQERDALTRQLQGSDVGEGDLPWVVADDQAAMARLAENGKELIAALKRRSEAFLLAQNKYARDDAVRELIGGDPNIQRMSDLFGDPNVGRTGQQEMFGADDLEGGRKMADAPQGGAAPIMPGKITEAELAGRPDLGTGAARPEGYDDPGQGTLLMSVPPPHGAPTTLGGPPAGTLDIATGQALAEEYRKKFLFDTTRPVPKMNAAPVRPVTDAAGNLIPKGMSLKAATEAGVGLASGTAAAATGDTPDEAIGRGVAGALIGVGATKFGNRLAEAVAAARRAVHTPELKNLQQMTEELSRGFGIPTRSGTRWWSEVPKKEIPSSPTAPGGLMGYFFTPGRMVRLRYASQFETATHEIGHVLSFDLDRLAHRSPAFMDRFGPNTMNELYGLGHALYAKGSPGLMIEEGIAEWARRFVMGQDVDALAPDASKFVRHLLENHPTGKAALEQARADWGRHLAGTIEERAVALRQHTIGDTQSRAWLRNFYDRNVDIRAMVEALGINPDRSRNVLFQTNAYSQIRMSARANAMAEWAIKHGVTDDVTGMRMTSGLEDIFKALKADELDDFESYLHAERTLELADRSYTVDAVGKDGRPYQKRIALPAVSSGMDLATAQALVAKYRPHYQTLAQKVWDHQAAMIVLRQQAGLLTAQEARIILESNAHHVPLYRVFDPAMTRTQPRVNGKMAKSGSGLFGIKGSERAVEPILENILADTYHTYTAVERHKAAALLLDAAKNHPTGATALTILQRPPVERTAVAADAALRQLEGMGWPANYSTLKRSRKLLKDAKVLAAAAAGDAGAQDQLDAAKQLVELYESLATQQVHEFHTIRQPTKADQRELVMPVMYQGKRVWVQINDVNLYEALNGLHGQSAILQGLADLAPRTAYSLEKSVDLFRQSATLYPGFIKRNPIRDAWTAVNRSEKEGIPILGEHLIRGMGVMLAHYAKQNPRAGRALQYGAPLAGAAFGYSQGDTPGQRKFFALLGAAAGGLTTLSTESALRDAEDLYDLWMRKGGGGATLSGLDRASHQRSINEMLRSTGERRIMLTHPIEMLRAVSQMSETATRLGELQVVLRQQLKRGNTMYHARNAALMAAAEVSQDFTKGGQLGMALNKIFPFFNAGLVGKQDFIRDLGKPERFRRMLVSIGLPSVALWALQRDDPEYQDIPQYEKDNGWPVVWPPKAMRDFAKKVAAAPDEHNWMPSPLRDWFVGAAEAPTIRYVVPKPFERGVVFGTILERSFESIARAFDNDPTTDPGGSGGIWKNLPQLGWDLIRPGSMTPIIGTAFDLAQNRDFAGREIVPERFDENYPAEERATKFTGETARLLARESEKVAAPFGGHGFPAAGIQHAVTGVLGPLADVPMRISDAVLREVRERQGKPPLRAPPREGFTTLPASWNRAIAKGAQGLQSQNLQDFYDTLAKARAQWSRYQDAIESHPQLADQLEKDPYVNLYRTLQEGGGELRFAERDMRQLRDDYKLAIEQNDTQEAQRLEREMIELARRTMKEVARARQN